MKMLMATLLALTFAFSLLAPAAATPTIPCGAAPFQAQTLYMSLTGYQRYLSFQEKQSWITLNAANMLVEERQLICMGEGQM